MAGRPKNPEKGRKKDSPHWNRYWSMKQRCTNKNHHRYKDWGGRGITVCQEWLDDFWAYADYVESLPHANEKGLTIDRINNDEGYYPGNLRWASKSIQSFNRKRWGKGYRFCKEKKDPKKWRVRLTINGKKESFGYFLTEGEAKNVANFAKQLIENSFVF